MPKSKARTLITIQVQNEDFILHLNDMPSITEYFNKNSDVKVAKWIAKRLKPDNTILLNILIREKIMKDLKISASTVDRAIKALKADGFLLNDPELSCTTYKVKQYAIFKKSNKKNEI